MEAWNKHFSKLPKLSFVEIVLRHVVQCREPRKLKECKWGRSLLCAHH